MDIQLSYLCVHLHTYVHRHTGACAHAYATHINTVEKQRREKNFKMLSIILFIR